MCARANHDAIIIKSLKERWFQLAKQENYPKTPDVTAQLDAPQKEIQQRAIVFAS